MRRNFCQGFAEFKVIAKFFTLLFGNFGFRADKLTGALDDFSEPSAKVGTLAKIFRENVADAEQDVGDVVDLPIGIDKVGGALVEIRRLRTRQQNFCSERFELS